jgi:hypothetical protein
MDWRTILILAVLISGLSILWWRVESRIRAPVVIVVYIPSILLILKWTQFRDAWADLGIASFLGIAIFLIWWVPYGRKLAPPKGSEITVLTPDDDDEE